MLRKDELYLLSAFRQNARMPLTELSRRSGIPISTIHDKLRVFERDIIERHTTLIDFRKLGYSLKMHFLLRVSTEDKERFERHIHHDEHVNTLLKISNGFNYQVEAIFRDVKELNMFLMCLEGFRIEEKKEYLVLEDLRRESFLTNSLLFGDVA